MNALPCDGPSLWALTTRSGIGAQRFIADPIRCIPLTDLRRGSNIDAASNSFRGKCVLIACDRQLPAVLAMLQLDGVAHRLLLLPPGVAATHLPAIVDRARVEVIVTDRPTEHGAAGAPVVVARDTVGSAAATTDRVERTEWVLFTSGTTGEPKMVRHTLRSLTGPLAEGPVKADNAVWSTFYDVRRYGGLQILLRALLGGGSMVLSAADEPVTEFLSRVGRDGVTHVSGTPSHWRRALISGAIGRLTANYLRLSGEVADQGILDALRTARPGARISHAFASTEAGVGFEVHDGKAGFPRGFLERPDSPVALRVQDGSLRIRSSRTASGYLGQVPFPIGPDGFVDTGDMVVPRGDRYYFVGRRDGVINVGGQKVHPEEVEAVLNRHPDVQVSRVRGQRSRITGEIVVADIVTCSAVPGRAADEVDQTILDACRAVLPAFKVPAILRRVPALDIDAAGKLVRRCA